MNDFNKENNYSNTNDFNRIDEPKYEVVEETNKGQYTDYFAMDKYEETTNQSKVSKKPRRKGLGKVAAVVAGALVCAVLGGAVGGTGVYLLYKDKITSNSNKTNSNGNTITYNASTVTTSATKDGLSAVEIAKKVSPAVVGVSVKSIVRNNYSFITEQDGIGSGFIINEEGYILTNYHVISGAQQVKVILSDGTEVNAKVINYDSEQDIAVIKITDNIKVPGVVELGDSSQVQSGEDVIAIGNPLGKEFSSSVTKGIVSNANRKLQTDDGKQVSYIQTDAAISPGNSGGPLINSRGQVIGINAAKKVGEGVEGIGFSIPINTVKERLDALSKPILKLGISVRDVDAATAKANDIQEGIYIVDVAEFSAAEKAGVNRGDLIISFDGTRVKTVDELNKLKEKHKEGDVVKITVLRDKKEVTLNVTLTN
jgi:serine protease Do